MSFAPATTTGTDETIEEFADRLAPTPSVLLAVWAHPDDESFLGAGLMAEIARRGGRVINVTATVGEHGTPDPTRRPPVELAAERREELDAALGVLGAEHGIVLGYSDGACEQVPDALGARRVGSIIDEVRPDLVLGFGPDGVTGHPDHRAVGRWTDLALRQRGDRIPHLTTAAGAAWPEVCVDRLHQIEAFWPGYPERGVDRPHVTTRLDGAPLDRKQEAMACHRSQIGPVQDVLGPTEFRLLASVEAYRGANAAARDPDLGHPAGDRLSPATSPNGDYLPKQKEQCHVRFHHH